MYILYKSDFKFTVYNLWPSLVCSIYSCLSNCAISPYTNAKVWNIYSNIFDCILHWMRLASTYYFGRRCCDYVYNWVILIRYVWLRILFYSLVSDKKYSGCNKIIFVNIRNKMFSWYDCVSVELYLKELNLALQDLHLCIAAWNRQIGKTHVGFASAFSGYPMGKVSRHKQSLQEHPTDAK